MEDLIKKNSVKATLTSIKGKKAILILEDNQVLLWPAHLLPKGIKVGSVLYLNLTNQKSGALEQENLAQALLNEILGN